VPPERPEPVESVSTERLRARVRPRPSHRHAHAALAPEAWAEIADSSSALRQVPSRCSRCGRRLLMAAMIALLAGITTQAQPPFRTVRSPRAAVLAELAGPTERAGPTTPPELGSATTSSDQRGNQFWLATNGRMQR
jgi:hypothetical protein